MDSDSVDLGSNPGSPATSPLEIHGFLEAGQTGQTRTDSAREPHKSRHIWEPTGLQPPPLDGHDWETPPPQELIGEELDWLTLLLNTSVTGWPDRSNILDLEPLMNLRLFRQLAFEVGAIHPNLLPLRCKFTRERGEGPAHVFAKRAAMAWLEDMGSPLMEHSFTGGRVDVYCRNRRIVVECGSLSARRLIDLIRDDDFAARVILVPLTAPAFTAWMERDERPPIPFVEVKRLGGWRNTLLEAREERRLRPRMGC